ncbi:hypothetical protein SLEP1_g25954 [Rubroshorea leprosula]|uniref:Uncharacterized protein n=1 Tax=Rubroshorea leprosula TaxID=152421 RepID=A0AAV5JUA8_9ROSI|nr:hypothetical protein SLEP1_g25954 [Rubroshorea leprosula]
MEAKDLNNYSVYNWSLTIPNISLQLRNCFWPLPL